MQSEKNSEIYMSTISMYFVFSGIISISMKALACFITVNVLVGLIIGIFAMLAGSYFGRLTRSKTKPAIIKKAVYAVMSVSGLINIITSLAEII